MLFSDNSLGGQQRALLIGINDYLANDEGEPDPPSGVWIPEDLKGAVNDISLMQQILIRRFGFTQENITRLQNRDASREAILKTLAAFVEETGPDDVVYIHFSGHGSQVEDQNGDEEDGLDETILSHDARTSGVADITDDELGKILAGLDTESALLVFDSCHSGTATRGASLMQTRAVPIDSRRELYGSDLELQETKSKSDQSEYVLMTGAADNQSALDGPIDDGRYYGLFTLSMGRVLSRLPVGASAKEVHSEVKVEMQRIAEQFGLYAIPEPQLEASESKLDVAVLGEGQTAARLAWSEVSTASDNTVDLHGAGTLAAETGSVWAIYPPGETEFNPGSNNSLVTVTEVSGKNAIAVFEGRGESIKPGSRAVQVIPAASHPYVSMRLNGMSDTTRKAIDNALQFTSGGQAINLVKPGQFARYMVDQKDSEIVVHAADGLQQLMTFPAADPLFAAEQLAKLARRSTKVNEVLSLYNPAGKMRLKASVKPMDSSGQVRGVAVVGASTISAFKVRKAGELRNHANSLILEIVSSHDSFLTIVDVDPEGSVAVLFPNPISERNGFYPDGFIRSGRSIRIPDALEDNEAGFNWDYVPPTGVDTIRVFAAKNLATARKIRAYIGHLSTSQTQRSGPTSATGIPARDDLYRLNPATKTRGVAVVEAGDSTSPADWTATSVTLMIED